MTWDRLPASSVPAATQSERSEHRHELANRICAFSPDRFFYTRRNSMQPCFRIENGMRRLVFSFWLAQAALLLDCPRHFACQVFRALFQQPREGGRLAIDRQSFDAH